VQYSDYPYAKFNVKLDKIIYTDEEYEGLLKDDDWTRDATDHLMDICYQYDLRWPVVADRYALLPSRTTEALMHRYYSIMEKIRAHRLNQDEINARIESFTAFNVKHEIQRRKQQEALFRK
jgi:DNA methyltransferase 1-associated protein 1